MSDANKRTISDPLTNTQIVIPQERLQQLQTLSRDLQVSYAHSVNPDLDVPAAINTIDGQNMPDEWLLVALDLQTSIRSRMVESARTAERGMSAAH